MTPAEIQQLKDTIESQVGASIQAHVNGKIDKLSTFMENHAKEDKAFQDRIEPFLQGVAGLKTM